MPRSSPAAHPVASFSCARAPKRPKPSRACSPKWDPPACRPGRAYCCRLYVSVRADEARALADELRRLPPDKLDGVRRRLAENAARAKDTRSESYPKMDCALLTSECTCSAYDTRPFSCRQYHSNDVEACRRADRGEVSGVLEREGVPRSSRDGAIAFLEAMHALRRRHRELRASAGARYPPPRDPRGDPAPARESSGPDPTTNTGLRGHRPAYARPREVHRSRRSGRRPPTRPDFVDQAMRALSRGETKQVLRSIVPLSEGRAFGVMPGALGAHLAFGAKVVSVFQENFARGKQSHQGLLLLFDPESGAPICAVHAGELTAIRTAAASAVATRASPAATREGSPFSAMASRPWPTPARSASYAPSTRWSSGALDRTRGAGVCRSHGGRARCSGDRPRDGGRGRSAPTSSAP